MSAMVMRIRNEAMYATYLPFLTKMISKALSRFKDQGKEWNKTGVPSIHTRILFANINGTAFVYDDV